jgi:hypothetical protein
VLEKFAEQDSLLGPPGSIREGVVVRPTSERFHDELGRVIVKLISQRYRLDDTPDRSLGNQDTSRSDRKKERRVLREQTRIHPPVTSVESINPDNEAANLSI